MMLRAADPLAAQDVSMPIDNALKQRRVVIEGRSANSGPLRLFVPHPDLHGFVVERVSAEGCNLLGIHRSTLKRKRVGGTERSCSDRARPWSWYSPLLLDRRKRRQQPVLVGIATLKPSRSAARKRLPGMKSPRVVDDEELAGFELECDFHLGILDQ